MQTKIGKDSLHIHILILVITNPLIRTPGRFAIEGGEASRNHWDFTSI